MAWFATAAFEAAIRGPVHHLVVVVGFFFPLVRIRAVASIAPRPPKLFCHFYMAWPASIHSSARAHVISLFAGRPLIPFHCSVCFSVPGSASASVTEKRTLCLLPVVHLGEMSALQIAHPWRRATTSKGDAPTDKVRGAFRRFCKAFQRKPKEETVHSPGPSSAGSGYFGANLLFA